MDGSQSAALKEKTMQELLHIFVDLSLEMFYYTILDFDGTAPVDLVVREFRGCFLLSVFKTNETFTRDFGADTTTR